MKTRIDVEGDLRIWHIPQIPGTPFHVHVKSIKEAKKILDLLADYDDFQFKENIKPDYSSVAGLEVFEGGRWCEWYNEDGEDIESYQMIKNLTNQVLELILRYGWNFED